MQESVQKSMPIVTTTGAPIELLALLEVAVGLRVGVGTHQAVAARSGEASPSPSAARATARRSRVPAQQGRVGQTVLILFASLAFGFDVGRTCATRPSACTFITTARMFLPS